MKKKKKIEENEKGKGKTKTHQTRESHRDTQKEIFGFNKLEEVEGFVNRREPKWGRNTRRVQAKSMCPHG